MGKIYQDFIPSRVTSSLADPYPHENERRVIIEQYSFDDKHHEIKNIYSIDGYYLITPQVKYKILTPDGKEITPPKRRIWVKRNFVEAIDVKKLLMEYKSFAILYKNHISVFTVENLENVIEKFIEIMIS